MANTAQAKKRARQNEATRKRNASLRSALRSAVRNVKKAIVAGDKAAATKEFQAQQSVIRTSSYCLLARPLPPRDFW